MEHLRAVAGSCLAPLRAPRTGSCEWAGLEPAGEARLADLLAEGPPPAGTYRFDWSLPLHCPRLAEQFSVPELFRANYLTRTSPSALYHDSWPSLFVAAKGTHGGLHIDAFGSHFWMYLVSGGKRWTFYPADQVWTTTH
jgi:hypothetical protein